MSDIGTIIDIWLKNNEWTHKMLAEKMFVSESTVQKWKQGKRHPDPEKLKRLSDIMLIDIRHFYESNYLPYEFVKIDEYVPPCLYGENFIELARSLGCNIPEDEIKYPKPRQETSHDVFDAGLYKDAKLHRWIDLAGQKCSAIYLGGEEIWWHYRDHENQMIHEWNKQGGEAYI